MFEPSHSKAMTPFASLVPSSIPPLAKARVLQHERAVIVEDEPRLLREVADGIRQFAIEEEGARWPRQRRKVCRWRRSRRGKGGGLACSSWRGRRRTSTCDGNHQERDEHATANSGGMMLRSAVRKKMRFLRNACQEIRVGCLPGRQPTQLALIRPLEILGSTVCPCCGRAWF